MAAGAGIALVALGATSAPTRAEDEAERGRLVALELGSGAVQFDVAAPTASAHIHATGEGVVVLTGADDCSGAVVSGEKAFAYSLPSGALRWQRPGGGCFDYDNPSVTSHGAVVMGDGRGVEAWRLSDGRTRWRQPRVRASYQAVGTSTAAVGIHYESATVSVMDWKNGRVLRTFDVPFKPSPWRMRANTAILVAQRWAPLQAYGLAAVNLRSGRVLWRRSLGRGALYGRTPGADGVILAVSATAEDTTTSTRFAAVALDERTGTVLWRRVLPAVADPPYASAIAAVGAGLAVIRDGASLHALDLRTGRPRWEATVATARGDEQAKVAAGGGVVAVVDAAGVTVLDADDGQVRWTAASPSGGWIGEPAIHDGRLLVPYVSPAFVPYRG